jgi:hypothetical protein
VTHPFHPLVGREFEVVTVRNNWGENRVHYHDERGRLVSIPTPWTSLGAEDPFVVVAAGRACMRVADLIRLAEIIERSREEAGR